MRRPVDVDAASSESVFRYGDVDEKEEPQEADGAKQPPELQQQALEPPAPRLALEVLQLNAGFARLRGKKEQGTGVSTSRNGEGEGISMRKGGVAARGAGVQEWVLSSIDKRAEDTG